MNNIFGKVFYNLLEQDVAENLPPSGEEMSDQDAMQSTGTNPADMEINTPSQKVMQATSDAQKHMIGELKQWIEELSQFSEYLNGMGPDSIQSKLRSSIADTIFDKIKVAENKKIARVAMELRSLNEMLKGYLSTASDAKYKFF